MLANNYTADYRGFQLKDDKLFVRFKNKAYSTLIQILQIDTLG